jgi:hypothetical protein
MDHETEELQGEIYTIFNPDPVVSGGGVEYHTMKLLL